MVDNRIEDEIDARIADLLQSFKTLREENERLRGRMREARTLADRAQLVCRECAGDHAAERIERGSELAALRARTDDADGEVKP